MSDAAPAEATGTKLFIGNLSWEVSQNFVCSLVSKSIGLFRWFLVRYKIQTNDSTLEELFSKYGVVREARVAGELFFIPMK